MSSQAELLEVGVTILSEREPEISNDGRTYRWADMLEAEDKILGIEAKLLFAEFSINYLKEIDFTVRQELGDISIVMQPNKIRPDEATKPDAFVEFVLGSFRSYLHGNRNPQN